MSEGIIFGIGAIVFAITVYGSVMAGGLGLARIEAKEQSDEDDLELVSPSAIAAAPK